MLERLGDEDIQGDKLDAEIIRSKAIVDISKIIISNANLVLEAEKFKQDTGLIGKEQMPDMLKVK